MCTGGWPILISKMMEEENEDVVDKKGWDFWCRQLKHSGGE